jgi:hypothetical protein
MTRLKSGSAAGFTAAVGDSSIFSSHIAAVADLALSRDDVLLHREKFRPCIVRVRAAALFASSFLLLFLVLSPTLLFLPSP